MSFFAKLFGRKPVEPPASDAAPPRGWLFLDSMLDALYPGQHPKHAAPLVSPHHDLRPGRSPIEGTNVYDAGDAWHYVTLGLTDLYEKSAPGDEASGVGCELSMRVAKRGRDVPPMWPVALLANVAAAVDGGARLAQAVSFRMGPVEGTDADDPPIEGVVALLDPAIAPQQGPFGKVAVMLLVGLTGAQLDAIADGGSAALIAAIAADPQRWVT